MSQETDAPELVPVQVRAAVVIIALESLALVGAAVVLLVKIVFGSPTDLAGALLLVLLALVGAGVLAMCARGLTRLRSSSRSPVVVLQLLAIPVSYSLAFQAHRVAYGGPIILAALVTLYLLFTPPARAVLERRPD
ncbi:MAG: hypothetical protein ABI232_02505 [Jatrophihabitantaceae bacterium]